MHACFEEARRDRSRSASHAAATCGQGHVRACSFERVPRARHLAHQPAASSRRAGARRGLVLSPARRDAHAGWRCGLRPRAGGCGGSEALGRLGHPGGAATLSALRLAVHRLADALGFSLDAATFSKDSLSDLPLLERVNEPVAVNPDPRLAWLAKKRGWRVERW